MREKRGFTLIEVMISMAILSFGLLALLRMTYTYVQANTFNHMFSEAVVSAQDKMEQLRSYAASDRVDRFSVFDFDYLVSDQANFTTVLDPSTNSNIDIHGLLSGSNGGAAVPVPWGINYDVMYDDGTHGDTAGGDGIYANEDDREILRTSGAPITVHRVWTVEPFTPPNAAKPEYALLGVTVTWTDKYGVTHTNELKSCINRRQ